MNSHLVHKKSIPQNYYDAMRGSCDIIINEEDSTELMPIYEQKESI